ncbi:MAG: hypothetical protein AB7P42_09600 [Gammaproteobacteria bacterium]
MGRNREFDPATYHQAFDQLQSEVNKHLTLKPVCRAVERAQERLKSDFDDATRLRSATDLTRKQANASLEALNVGIDAVKTNTSKWQSFNATVTTGVAKVAYAMLDKAKLPKDKQTKVESARTLRNLAVALGNDGDFDLAKTRLDEGVTEAKEALADVIKTAEERFERIRQPLMAIMTSIDRKDYGDPPPPGLRDVIKHFEGVGGRCRGLQGMLAVNYVDLMDAITEVEDAIPKVRKAVDEAVKKMGGTASTPAEKKLAMGALQARFGIQLDHSKRCECGPSAEPVGTKCPKCKTAVNEPVYSSKILPKLYSLLDGLPPGHVVDNPSFKNLRRNRNDDASFYRSSDQSVVLNLKQTSGPRGMVNNVKHTINNIHHTGKGSLIVDEFQDFAYHEVAHAVDDKTGYMDTHGKQPDHGGWEPSSREEVLKIAGEALGFYADFAGAPHAFLRAFLEDSAKGKPAKVKKGEGGDQGTSLDETWNASMEIAKALPKTLGEFTSHPAIAAAIDFRRVAAPKGDEQFTLNDLTENFKAEWKTVQIAYSKAGAIEIRNMYAECCKRIGMTGEAPDAVYKSFGGGVDFSKGAPPKPDFKALAKHKAVDWIKNVVMSGGESGLWDQGDSGAKKYAVKGRVYQQAYTSSWWSYDLAARGDLIVNYQFRAPGEWFAEAYAAHHIGKLPSKHVVAKYLKSDEGKRAPKKQG